MYFFMMKEQDLYNTLPYVTVTVGFRRSVRTWVRTMQIQTVIVCYYQATAGQTLTCWLTPHLSSSELICPTCGLQQPTRDFLDRTNFNCVFTEGMDQRVDPLSIKSLFGSCRPQGGHRTSWFSNEGSINMSEFDGLSAGDNKHIFICIVLPPAKITHFTTLWKYCKHHS